MGSQISRPEELAEIMLHRANADPDYLRRVCFSDESTFHTSGLVHRHNCRIWGQEKPREIRQWERASPKVNVWCGVFIDAIIGPFFFEDQTVNQKNFLEMLEGQIIPEVLRKREDAIFQLDGAPPHWGLQVRGMLNDVFPDGWIGRGGPTSWPPRSPDVTPLDFFLWGYVKTKVFTKEIADIEELKTRITHAVASVTPQMLLNTWKEFEKRLLKLRENGGKHVEG